MGKYITCVPGEFVLSSSNNRTPLHIDGGTGVGCHLEVGHIAQWSCTRERWNNNNFNNLIYLFLYIHPQDVIVLSATRRCKVYCHRGVQKLEIFTFKKLISENMTFLW